MNDDPLLLLEIAEGDLQLAAELLEGRRPYRRQIAFHLQQAVEKYLKAVVLAEGHNPPRLRSLAETLHFLPELLPEIAASPRVLERINDFAVAVRYYGELPTMHELQEVRSACDEIRSLVLRRLGLTECVRAELAMDPDA